MSWTPPSTFVETLKRALIPARLEVARITAREWARGERELRLAPLLVDPTRHALDVGANRGIWSAVMARTAKSVIAFEPNPKLFAVLKAGAGPTVDCRQIAASDADGTARLLVPMSRGGFSNQHASLEPMRMGDKESRAVEVRAARLDGLDLPPVGFIKVDVEGHEVAALRGAAGLIARDRPTLVVEIEARHTGRPVADMVAEIAALGPYRVLFLGPHGLRDFSAFDEATHQPPAGPGEGRVYVNNFIFVAA